MPSPKVLTRKAKAKAILLLVTELTKYGIMEKVMYEFKKQKLDIVYQKEIEEWKKLVREEKFSEKLDQSMKKEIERFLKDRK